MEQLDFLDYVIFSEILSDAKDIVKAVANFYGLLSPNFGVILLLPVIILFARIIIDIMMSILTIGKFKNY